MPVKPTDKEQEYILRLEADKLRKAARQHRAQLAAEEKERLKALHWMRCPKCGHELQTLVYRDVEVDRCFGCGGTWLDDGEIEKIEASTSFLQSLQAVFRESTD